MNHISGKFQSALNRKNEGAPPVWFMRQAGRYHSHYQALKKKHDFMELCKVPELAAEVTLGPIQFFGFDAAILFSDLLFPLEAMGMGLTYDPAPKLGFLIQSSADLSRLALDPPKGFFDFQNKALAILSHTLPRETGKIGFIGAPLTLYFYAAYGSHKEVNPALAMDGRYPAFCERLMPFLIESARAQASANPDALAIFDTCGGDLDPVRYAQFAIPPLKSLVAHIKAEFPGLKIIYYSKGTSDLHFKALADHVDIDCMGVDWNVSLPSVLEKWGNRFAIQGNLDPHALTLPFAQFSSELEKYCASLKNSKNLGSWISGLGHGVLKESPEAHVLHAVRTLKERFGG